MGLILDSSVVVGAERRGDTIEQFIERIVDATGDQQAALSAVGVTELIHGIYRAETPERRARREETPAARSNRHQDASTHAPSTTCRNTDVHRSVPVGHAV